MEGAGGKQNKTPANSMLLYLYANVMLECGANCCGLDYGFCVGRWAGRLVTWLVVCSELNSRLPFFDSCHFSSKSTFAVVVLLCSTRYDSGPFHVTFCFNSRIVINFQFLPYQFDDNNHFNLISFSIILSFFFGLTKNMLVTCCSRNMLPRWPLIRWLLFE